LLWPDGSTEERTSTGRNSSRLKQSWTEAAAKKWGNRNNAIVEGQEISSSAVFETSKLYNGAQRGAVPCVGCRPEMNSSAIEGELGKVNKTVTNSMNNADVDTTKPSSRRHAAV